MKPVKWAVVGAALTLSGLAACGERPVAKSQHDPASDGWTQPPDITSAQLAGATLIIEGREMGRLAAQMLIRHVEARQQREGEAGRHPGAVADLDLPAVARRAVPAALADDLPALAQDHEERPGPAVRPGKSPGAQGVEGVGVRPAGSATDRWRC